MEVDETAEKSPTILKALGLVAVFVTVVVIIGKIFGFITMTETYRQKGYNTTTYLVLERVEGGAKILSIRTLENVESGHPTPVGVYFIATENNVAKTITLVRSPVAPAEILPVVNRLPVSAFKTFF
jgi:hypothetical protein